MVGIFYAFLAVVAVHTFWKLMMGYKPLADEDEVDADVIIDATVANRREIRDQWLKDLEEQGILLSRDDVETMEAAERTEDWQGTQA